MTKILLVEDDKSLREIYGVRLLAEGYDIVSAGDGEEALAMAIKERPQLIVSDVMMPKISGFDMLDILRSTTETKDIKVIMMTALSSEDQRARGEALGADRYLVKSQVGIEDVVRTVHEVLGDAPVSSAPAANPFIAAQPRPAAQAAPAPRPEAQQPAAYTRPAQPQQPQPAAPQQPQPAAPISTAYTPPQTPSPQPAPQPTQIPVSSGLPQPTAPFSTTRPANLGDRIIHPLTQPASSQPDISNLMDQELHGAVAMPPTPPPIAPLAAQAATSTQPAYQQPPAQQPSAPASTAPISFEETPRQAPQQPPAL